MECFNKEKNSFHRLHDTGFVELDPPHFEGLD